MTYTLTLCLGMWLSLCGQIREYEYQSAAECEKARSAVSPKAIGDGYAICAPTKPKEKK
jgi:hypothetical protein